MIFNKIEVLAYLKQTFPEDKITELIDDEITSGNWVDSDWDEDGEYESEYDWYQEFGNGEAEDAVKNTIEEGVLGHFMKTKEDYLLEIGEEIYETIEEYSDRFQDPLDEVINKK